MYLPFINEFDAEVDKNATVLLSERTWQWRFLAKRYYFMFTVRHEPSVRLWCCCALPRGTWAVGVKMLAKKSKRFWVMDGAWKIGTVSRSISCCITKMVPFPTTFSEYDIPCETTRKQCKTDLYLQWDLVTVTCIHHWPSRKVIGKIAQDKAV